MKPNLKKQLTASLKILVSLFLIWLVFNQMDWSQIGKLIKDVNPFFFGLSFLMFLASQLVSVFRFDLFIRKIGIRMSLAVNIRLYLIGMFYNFFLPGGVGGDAYKVYLLNKSHRKQLKRIGELVFIERFIGLTAIGFLASVLILFIRTPFSRFWSLSVCILGFGFTAFILKRIALYLYSHKKRIHLVFVYSVAVQILQLGCIFFLLKSFEIDRHYPVYLLLFLISSMLSVISFAGLGIREAVFFYGASLYDFNPDISAGIGLTFSIFTAVVSFFGVVYLFGGIGFAENTGKIRNPAETDD